MSEKYDVGDQPTALCAFTDDAGNPASPTQVRFILRDPAGIETEYAFPGDPEISDRGGGVFAFAVPVLVDHGKYWVRAKGTEGLFAADEITFTVSKSAFVAP